MNVILCETEENKSTAGTVIIHHHFGICWYLSSSWWGLTSHDDQWGNKTANKLKKIIHVSRQSYWKQTGITRWRLTSYDDQWASKTANKLIKIIHVSRRSYWK